MLAVYCDSNTERTKTLCGQTAELYNVTSAGKYAYHNAEQLKHIDFLSFEF